MKKFDVMSYQELTAAKKTIEGQLSIIKLNPIKTDRVINQQKRLLTQIREIEKYIILAKLDIKACNDLGKSIIEQILKSYGVYNSRMHEHLYTRLTARHVDVYYNCSEFSFSKFKTIKGFKRHLNHKLQLLLNYLLK